MGVSPGAWWLRKPCSINELVVRDPSRCGRSNSVSSGAGPGMAAQVRDRSQDPVSRVGWRGPQAMRPGRNVTEISGCVARVAGHCGWRSRAWSGWPRCPRHGNGRPRTGGGWPAGRGRRRLPRSRRPRLPRAGPAIRPPLARAVRSRPNSSSVGVADRPPWPPCPGGTPGPASARCSVSGVTRAPDRQALPGIPGALWRYVPPALPRIGGPTPLFAGRAGAAAAGGCQPATVPAPGVSRSPSRRCSVW